MNFDESAAEKYLIEKDQREKQEFEGIRKQVLAKTKDILTAEFLNSKVEVYLVGSILRPFAFSTHSDIDVVLKNYQGVRFDLWSRLEKKIGRDVEIILFETCPFKEFVLTEGLKVL